MKKLRQNLRVVTALLLSLLIVAGTYCFYSVTTYGGRWFATSTNTRLASQKKQVVAGDIADRTGLVLACTVDGKRTYPRYTGLRKAVAHVVGDNRGFVSHGAETFMASYLLGFKASATERAKQLFSGGETRGDDIALTIDAELCAYASSLITPFVGGAVVVINYKTGEILCSTSWPSFDPRNMTAALNASSGEASLLNRATQGMYSPGSTFKIVTMASALSNFSDAQTRLFNCTGRLDVVNTTVTEAGGAVHGQNTLQTAFAKSCNSAFSTLAMELGASRLRWTASDFGFNENFLFSDLIVYNSVFPSGRLSKDQLAWNGIGQGTVQVTPLHMAMIAGAIGNGGNMMELRLLLSATGAQGNARALPGARVYKRCCNETVAAAVKDAMIECVQSGTGKQAQIKGYTVAGKTGSAETSDNKSVRTDAWFAGFVDDPEHPLAIAVVLEKGGSGGTVAAPIAQRVLNRAIKMGY